MKLFLVLLLVFSFSGLLLADENKSTETVCCFTNPQFAGGCKVNLGKDETCADILKYLNTAGTAGKTYCNNTKIRGGWEKVTCEKKDDQQASADYKKVSHRK